MAQYAAFAIGVLCDIYGCHPYTARSTYLYQPAWPPTDALRPVNPDNAWTLRITAAAGTELAGPYSNSTVIIILFKSSLHAETRLPARGIAPSGFPPLRNIPYCCLP